MIIKKYLIAFFVLYSFCFSQDRNSLEPDKEKEYCKELSAMEMEYICSMELWEAIAQLKYELDVAKEADTIRYKILENIILDKMQKEHQLQLGRIKNEPEALLYFENRNNKLNEQDIFVIIDNLFPSSPNSAGGVDCYLGVEYINNKIIKYARYDFEAFNAVGDKVVGRYNDILHGSVTGPIEPVETNHHWENAWYNNTITCVKLIKVELEYMDGSKDIYIEEIPKLFLGWYKDCTYKGKL